MALVCRCVFPGTIYEPFYHGVEDIDCSVWRRVTTSWRPDWFDKVSFLYYPEMQRDCWIRVSKKPDAVEYVLFRANGDTWMVMSFGKSLFSWNALVTVERFISTSGLFGPYYFKRVTMPVLRKRITTAQFNPFVTYGELGAIQFVQLATRVEKVCSIVRCVGLIACLLKQIYEEVSLRPHNSGARRAASSFYLRIR